MPLFQGIVGNLSSGKSALVHRYLTGTYVQEESPEGKSGSQGVWGWAGSSLLSVVLKVIPVPPPLSWGSVMGLCSSPRPHLGCPLLAPPILTRSFAPPRWPV